ncbi:MAG TPA: hypothetical protein VMV49_02060 [Candidatus Deferrimicrobium sp.]|nr:hypothetical protein [Candidatus Deferrimicrobium sp.]
MHNKWLHTWVLGVVSIFIIAPLAGLIAWLISKYMGFFWIVFWFYVGMGIICIIIDAINHKRSHRGLFTHSDGCYSLKLFQKEEKKS